MIQSKQISLSSLPPRKSSQISNQNVKNYQSTKHSQLNSPQITTSSNASLKSQSPKVLQKQQHSHKNSQIDIKQFAKLIQQQKDDHKPIKPNTPTGQQQLQKPQISNQALYLTNILARAKEINPSMQNAQSPANTLKKQAPNMDSQKHLKHMSSDLGQSKSPDKIIMEKNMMASQLKQTKMNNFQAQNFVKPQQIKDNIVSKNLATEGKELQQQTKGLFNFLYVIGIGGFGKVWKVETKKNGSVCAMKEMSKSLVITKKSVSSVMNERQILCDLKNPFIVNMHCSFQDRENLYLVMDYMAGGDLRYHIGRMRRFNEEITRFFIACIFSGLDYLHTNNIIQRDIKPENLVLDERGYVRITDMGISRILRAENNSDTSGTPGYMAPEVMCRQNHSFAVDYYALGVIAYEFMLGKRPYLGRSRQEIREQILAKQVQIKKQDIPEGWSNEAVDFINRLIQRKPLNRLGTLGANEIKQHPWFKNFPWQKLQNQELKSPFIPNSNEDNFDQKQIYIEDEENAELIQQNIMLLKDNSIQGYDYIPPRRDETLTTQPSSDFSLQKYGKVKSIKLRQL